MTPPLLRPFERDRAFESLQKMMAGEHPPLALIGSGASIGSGYPSWPKLVSEMAGLAGPNAQIPQRSQALAEDLVWAAEAHHRDIGPKDFSAYIKRRFGPPTAVGEPYPTLAAMRFRHFLTTNYDPCIELALHQAGEKCETLEWHDRGKLSRFLINFARPSPLRSVVYLHGRYSSPEKVILTESSYVERYIASDDARRKLLAIFMTHPVLFVGFSMNDPDFATVMREVTARLQSDLPCHYALIGYGSAPEREVYRHRMRGKFGVEPLFYSYAEGNDKHANLLVLLDALHGREPRKATASTKAMPAVSAVDPLDPQKGQWGGQAVAGGRRLRVARTSGSRADGWLTFDLVVEGLKRAPPLCGDVIFHLHPTFEQPVLVEKAQNGMALLKGCIAYGAFTVGISCDDGRTKLELDLAKVQSLPIWFRKR